MTLSAIGQTKDAQQRAIDKAQSLGIVRAVVRISSKRYHDGYEFRVPSVNNSKLYEVSPSFECDCKAGEQGRPCYHAAAAWLYELSFNRLPGPNAETIRKYNQKHQRDPYRTQPRLATKEARKQAADAFRKLLGE